MTRAMGHSPDGRDPQGLGAKPEWPGDAAPAAAGARTHYVPYTQRHGPDPVIITEQVVDVLDPTLFPEIAKARAWARSKEAAND